MSRRQFRFSLETDQGLITVNPRFEDDMDKEESKQPGQMFARDTLTGTLIFQRADFEAINNAPFDFFFIIHIDLKVGTGAWQDDWFKGKFSKTDCEFENSPGVNQERTVEVQPEPLDEYTDILEGMEREVNVIALAPAISQLTLYNQGVLQVYIPGSTVLMNFLAGTYWETEVEPIFTGLQTEPYGFGDFAYTVFVPGAGGGLDPDVSGTYIYGSGAPYDREDGHYRILFTGSGPTVEWKIVDLFDSNTVVYRMPMGQSPNALNPFDLTDIFPFVSETSDSECRVFSPAFVARLLTKKTEVLGNPTFPIPDPTYIPTPADYPDFTPGDPDVRALPIGALTNYLVSDLNSIDPTSNGKFSTEAANFAGRYFVKPVGVISDSIFPVNRFEWSNASVWFYYDGGIRAILEAAGTEEVYQDTYKFVDIVKAFLRELAPTITHEETSVYSQFLYGIGNAIRFGKKYPIFAPKSNILEGEYDKPAQTAKARFSDFLNFAKDFWQVYWYLDGNKFILEHVEYFRRGKTYGDPIVGTDLTVLTEPKTGKPWEYKSSKWKFDKVTLPQEIRHSWMDKVSLQFEGNPITMRSNYVEKGNFDERSLALFTSDIDFMKNNVDSISRDGFFFCEAVLKGANSYEIPFVFLMIDADNVFNMQNGWASMIWAHNYYWRHDLPCSEVTINGVEVTASSVMRAKVQEIEFGSSDTEADIMELAQTGLGVGWIEKRRTNLTSGGVNITIKHDTES